MKKVLFFVFTFISIATYGQELTTIPTSTNTNGTSVVVQKVDSASYNEIANIKNGLTYFYKANRNSQLLIYGGALMAITGAFISKDEMRINIFPVVGGVCSFVGSIIYLDSFKFLNMNKEKKLKAKRSRNYNDFY